MVPAIKLPSGAVRYRPEEIDAWLAERATGAARREVSPTRTSRTLDGAYGPISCSSSPTRPPHDEAARTEEFP
jgi:hypothetical protein